MIIECFECGGYFMYDTNFGCTCDEVCEHKFEKSYVCDSGTYVGFECTKCGMVVSCDVECPYENAMKGWNIILFPYGRRR